MTSVPHSGAKSVTPGGSVAVHTPGPWEVVRINERGQQTPDGDSWWVYAGNGNGWVGESYMSACIGSENGAEANARLIASAPDLLEACQEFLPILERQLASVNPGGIADGSAAVQTATARVERMRAAITRATGDRHEKGGAL